MNWFLLVLFVLFCSGVVTAQDVVVDTATGAPIVAPDPGTDVGAALSDLVHSLEGGETMAIVAALIFALLSLFKVPALRGWLEKLIPSRWLSVVAVALGVIWSVVAQVQTMGIWQAIIAGLLTGGGAVAIHEVVTQAIGGKDTKAKSALRAALEAGDVLKARDIVGGLK